MIYSRRSAAGRRLLALRGGIRLAELAGHPGLLRLRAADRRLHRRELGAQQGGLRVDPLVQRRDLVVEALLLGVGRLDATVEVAAVLDDRVEHRLELRADALDTRGAAEQLAHGRRLRGQR